MKILMFGGSGQLGQEIAPRALQLEFDLVSPHESELDLGNGRDIIEFVKKYRPEVIVNCAAYTAVDKAEEEKATCWRVNHEGAANVAQAAREVSARMIHVSTDYVFDGLLGRPLTEEDATNPQNVYGASKLAGEQEVLKILGERGLILRTQSLHGARGNNFVHTMLKLFSEKEKLQVVDDQFVCATWAGWLAEVILDLTRIETGGIYHAACGGVISWYQFACGILEMARPQLKKDVKIEPVKADKFPRPARRPVFSAFNCSKLEKTLGRKVITWQEGLRRHLSEIGYPETRI